MLRTRLALVMTLAAVGLSGCSGCDSGGGDDGPTCVDNGGGCSTGSDCCSEYCDPTFACADAPTCGTSGQDCLTGGDCCAPLTCQSLKCATFTCKAEGQSCLSTSDCCTQSPALTCDGNKCVVPTTCVVEGASCTAGGTRCCGNAYCDTASEVPSFECSTSACVPDGDTCVATQPCCSGPCGVDGKCPSTSEFCRPGGEACTSSTQCCSFQCDPGSGTCLTEACTQIGDACTDVSQCCSYTGTCEAGLTSGYCEAVPPGTKATDTCKTLGESCSAGSDCCSTNCVGGTCVKAYTCNATGDVCLVNGDCCSNYCDLTNTTSLAGRCLAPNGGCTQGGNPCDNASNCCSRQCKDPGSGVTVCTPAGGCRMTGDFCDSTASCCGGTPDAAKPDGYGVTCQVSSSDPVANCDNGTSCNPPGNICGAGGDNASQNCCFIGTGSGKPVCKPDANGIWRCFGGPVNTTCPAGYDGGNSQCCIPEGDVCQFRDQCCGFIPCVPDSTGILRCTSPTDSCLPAGTGCSAGGTPCCSPYGCVNVPEFGFICADTSTTPGCTPSGTGAANACTADTECCQGVCDPTGHCWICRPAGDQCTTGAECCDGVCDGGVCRQPQCLPAAADCSAAGASCCAPNTCVTTSEFGQICTQGGGTTTCADFNASCDAAGCCKQGYCTFDPADTTAPYSKTCEACRTNGDGCTSNTECCTDYCDPLTSKCANACVLDGGVCTASTDCCGGSTCVFGTGSTTGTCTAASFCSDVGQSCTSSDNCCTGLACDAELSVCKVPPATCKTAGQGCAVDGDCCSTQGLLCRTLDAAVPPNQVACTDPATQTCTCEIPTATCGQVNDACSTSAPCCTGTGLSCVGPLGSQTCQLPASCATPAGASCSLAQPCCVGDGTYCAVQGSAAICGPTDLTCVCRDPG